MTVEFAFRSIQFTSFHSANYFAIISSLLIEVEVILINEITETEIIQSGIPLPLIQTQFIR